MRSSESHSPSSGKSATNIEQPSEHERRRDAISHYLDRLAVLPPSLEKHAKLKQEVREIEEHYAGMSPREKANILYKKLMAYTFDKQAKSATDPYLLHEIKVLSADPATKTLFAETYAEARLDAQKHRVSELGNLWRDTSEEIVKKEEEYRRLEQDLNLKRITGQGKISVAESRMQRLAERLHDLERRRHDVEALRGFPETAENTDAAANFRYETLKEYRRQLENGFVWLPSRKKIHREIVSAILNHRWPVLIGEAGSGKSDQADAAAIELTGYPPTEIECELTTGEKQLISDIAIDPETGGSYDDYGPLMRAFTGYNDSRQQTPALQNGRIARFDESGRLGPKAYSVIKKVRQKKIGDDFYGHPVLPGAAAIWTTNPVGPRYPDRRAPDPAMRRELAEIHVPYPEMSAKEPELYEFMLAAIFDENNHISVAKMELAPAYEKKGVPENERETLADGSVVVARDTLIADSSDVRHGALWRFASAIKTLQDSFVYGNAETEKYPETLLRFKENADGVIMASRDQGEPLTLSTSTVTLGELASWMFGFNERMQKRDLEFRVSTLTEWLDFKIRTYLKQADSADRAKLEAIFRFFHFLEKSVPDVTREKPLAPKEIGYLSPRAARPAYLLRPHSERIVAESELPKKIERYENKQVLLDNGERVLMGIRDLMGSGRISLQVRLGEHFIVTEREYIFSGVVEDDSSSENGKPIGKLGGEELFRIFSPEEINTGLLRWFQKYLEIKLVDLDKEVADFCEAER